MQHKYLLESMTLIFKRSECVQMYGIFYEIPAGEHEMSALVIRNSLNSNICRGLITKGKPREFISKSKYET